MKLRQLFENIPEIAFEDDALAEKHIVDICFDSRKAAPGSLFVCLRGSLSDGHLYAMSAYEKGCRIFVAELPLDFLPYDATVFLVPNTRMALAKMSANLFEHPSHELCVIGITGTKGKTTTALMIYQIMNQSGIKCGYIGTSGVDYGDFHYETPNTTPESYTLQMYMRHMRLAGVTHLVMEVSSQALYLHRTVGVDFDICVYTNLSVDHIGTHEHPDFEHYKACKLSLFREYGAGLAVLNADDGYVDEFASVIPKDTKIVFYGQNARADHMLLTSSPYSTPDKLGIDFGFRYKCRKYDLSLPLPGDFNIKNALAAIAVCHELGVSIEEICRTLPNIRIAGRFELIEALPYATFVIDYAHNRASLEATLTALRAYHPKRLICLFGSVGGRTFGRRRELAEVASALCDLCILTADNPDSEAPQAIAEEIASHFGSDGCPYVIIPDRAEAIKHAVTIAEERDIILLAGKGHENYQLIMGEKIPFSEKEILKKASQGILLES